MENENPYVGCFTSLLELVTAVEKLPKTIDYLTVPTSYNMLGGSDAKLKWSDTLAEEVMDIMLKGILKSDDYVAKTAIDKKAIIDKYYLRSYMAFDHETSPYYIQYSTPEIRDFGNSMRNGDFGPLD